MKHNWIEVTDLIYIYPDNSWKYAEEHRSWMGDDYVAIDYGIICEEHDVWAKDECQHCLLETLDPLNDKPRRSGRGRIARTAQPSYNGIAADNQGSLRQGMPEVTPVK